MGRGKLGKGRGRDRRYGREVKREEKGRGGREEN